MDPREELISITRKNNVDQFKIKLTNNTKVYCGLPDLEYPFHDKTVTVTSCGRIYIHNKKINFSQVFAGQKVGIRETDDKIWLVSFMQYDIGYFDEEACRV